jgi:hypothetical protein
MKKVPECERRMWSIGPNLTISSDELWVDWDMMNVYLKKTDSVLQLKLVIGLNISIYFWLKYVYIWAHEVI